MCSKFTEFKSQTLIFICIWSVFLPIWFITTEFSDVKIILAFVIVPVVLIFVLNKIVYTGSRLGSYGSLFGPLVFALFLVYTLINWYTLSYSYPGNRMMAITWLNCLAFLCGCFIFSKPHLLKALWMAMLGVGIVCTLYLFAEYFRFVYPLGTNHTTPSALLSNINSFGLLVIYNSVAGLCLLFSCKTRVCKLWVIVALGIQYVALLFVVPRTSIVLLLAAGIVFLIPTLKEQVKKPEKRNVRILVYCTMAIICALFIVLWDDASWQHIAEFTSKPLGAVTSVSYRLYFYKIMTGLFLDHPVWGAGLGNLLYLGIPYWPQELRQLASAYLRIDNGHCEYLQILCELGIIGFTLVMILWVGALYRGIRQVRQSQQIYTYAMLIILGALLLHAGYSIEARRIPTSLLLWSTVGYFWREPFLRIWQTIPPLKRRLGGITFGLINCLLLGLFLQIDLGDYMFMQSIDRIKRTRPAGEILITASKVCPDHPYVLYQLAILSLEAKQYTYALFLADRLENVAPNFMSTDYIRASCLYYAGDYPRSLLYANQQINKRPNFLDFYGIKIQALAKLDSCTQVRMLKDSLLAQVPKLEKKYNLLQQPPSAVDSESRSFTGKVQSFIGGKHVVRNQVMENIGQMQLIQEKLKMLNKIKNTDCISQTSLPQ